MTCDLSIGESHGETEACAFMIRQILPQQKSHMVVRSMRSTVLLIVAVQANPAKQSSIDLVSLSGSSQQEVQAAVQRGA